MNQGIVCLLVLLRDLRFHQQQIKNLLICLYDKYYAYHNNIFDEELLKEEILFLKQKNEILKLKSDFYELIFYSFRNLIDASNPNNNMSEINVETITAEELKNKLLCIFTQNNQYFYDNLNFFHYDKSKDFLFSFY